MIDLVLHWGPPVGQRLEKTIPDRDLLAAHLKQLVDAPEEWAEVARVWSDDPAFASAAPLLALASSIAGGRANQRFWELGRFDTSIRLHDDGYAALYARWLGPRRRNAA